MNNLKHISITKLAVGSYVDSVSKQLGTVKVVKTGWVRDKKAIKRLKKEGVIEVIIDVSKQMAVKTNTVDITSACALKSITFEQEIEKAKTIEQNAKQTLGNIKHKILHNHPFDMSALSRLSESILASVKRNKNSLACVIRIYANSDPILAPCLRVAVMLAQCIADHKVEYNKAIAIILAGLLHDLGKLAQAPKTEAKSDFSHIDDLLNILELSGGAPELTVELCKHQLERLDGSGYPDKLTAEKTSQLTRLFIIVCEFDKLSCIEKKQELVGSITAFKLIKEQSPGMFDAKVMQTVIQSIGIYPAGTIVRLTADKIGFVKDFKTNTANSPIVHCIYNAQFNHYIAAKDLDLANEFVKDEIIATDNAKKYQLDLTQYI